MGKLPASLFYWGDFVRDPNVRRCTHAEVGVWIRLLCLMFDAETKGVLETNEIPWTDEEICLAIGGRFEETLQCVTALVTKGVASRNERGALMNRRMYREEKERVDTRERVRKHRAKQENEESGNAECNGVGNANDTRCTESEYETATEPGVSSPLEPKGKSSAKAEAIYAVYPRKVGRAAALKAITSALGRLTQGEGVYKFVPDEAAEFLRTAAAAFARSPAGTAGEYTPHPATWFNQSRYLDDPNEWQRRGGTTHAKPQRIDAIVSSHQGALELLEHMDRPAYLGGRSAETKPALGQLLEGSHGPVVGSNG